MTQSLKKKRFGVGQRVRKGIKVTDSEGDCEVSQAPCASRDCERARAWRTLGDAPEAVMRAGQWCVMCPETSRL